MASMGAALVDSSWQFWQVKAAAGDFSCTLHRRRLGQLAHVPRHEAGWEVTVSEPAPEGGRAPQGVVGSGGHGIQGACGQVSGQVESPPIEGGVALSVHLLHPEWKGEKSVRLQKYWPMAALPLAALGWVASQGRAQHT